MFAIGKFLSALAKLGSVLGAICIVLMMLHVTADVAGRYLFKSPLPGTIVVVAHYYMVILAFIGLGVAAEKKAHVTVDVFTDLFSKKIQGWFTLFGGLITVAVIAVLTVSGWTAAIKKTKSGAMMEHGSSVIEIWQSYWAIPLGAGLMLLIAGYQVVVTILGTRNGLEETDLETKFIND